MAVKKDITIQQGRRFAFSGTITKDGVGFSLTGYTMKLQAKRDKTQTVLDIDVALTPDSDQVANPGDYTGEILPTVTKNLDSGEYFFEISVFDGTGEKIYSPVWGEISLTRMVNIAPAG